VAFAVIENGRGTQAVHDAVVAYLANQRRGTACTKTMGDVNGTGRKPWRQKGTGRARAGSFASPLWVGGGVVFGPKPRDFGKRISTATKTLALRKALSERLKAGDVRLVEDLKPATPKTRDLAGMLAAMKVSGTTLLVGTGEDRNLRLASRNLAGVELTTASQVNTYQILRHQTLVFTRPAFAQVEQRLK
jgi:large subunit ribosomal protein L4